MATPQGQTAAAHGASCRPRLRAHRTPATPEQRLQDRSLEPDGGRVGGGRRQALPRPGFLLTRQNPEGPRSAARGQAGCCLGSTCPDGRSPAPSPHRRQPRGPRARAGSPCPARPIGVRPGRPACARAPREDGRPGPVPTAVPTPAGLLPVAGRRGRGTWLCSGGGMFTPQQGRWHRGGRLGAECLRPAGHGLRADHR